MLFLTMFNAGALAAWCLACQTLIYGAALNALTGTK